MEQRRLDRVLANTRPVLRALYSTLSTDEKRRFSKMLSGASNSKKLKTDEDLVVHTIVVIRESGTVPTFAEIAGKMGISEAQVQRYYNSGMDKLLRIFGDLGYDETDFI